MLLARDEVIEQSKRAYERWESIWHTNAEHNSKCVKQLPRIENKEVGKKCVIFAYGPSFKENIEAFVENKLHYEYDVICIDKALKSCLEYGVIPKYCIVSDAQVNFEEYGSIEPHLCRNTSLFASVTANHKWAEHWVKNGGDVYFYVNKDNIRTHHIFSKYIPHTQSYLIPASSNVGNCAYVFATLVLGYKEILLAAYDYSYYLTGDYYGNQKKEPVDTNLKMKKHNLYNHYTTIGIDNKLVQVSHNMQFSAKWLIDFIANMVNQKKCLTINITGRGILRIPNQAKVKRKELCYV